MEWKELIAPAPISFPHHSAILHLTILRLNYTYADMNGNTTISAIGADLAAKKGILFFNAAGNEGNGAWHFIITPSDADSVVAVGAVDTAGVVGKFSSFGPSSDGQVKPDVASVGVGAMIQTTVIQLASVMEHHLPVRIWLVWELSMAGFSGISII